MVVRRTALVLAASFLMTACGGGGSSSSSEGGGGGSSTVDNSQVNGVYLGQGDEEGFGVFAIVALVNEGEIFAVSETDISYSGSIVLEENNGFSSSLTLYDVDRHRFDGATMSGTYVSEESMAGNYQRSSGLNGEFALDYLAEIYEQNSGYDLISGTWTVSNMTSGAYVNFDDNGVIYGADDDGCVYSGQTSIPDSSVNMYEVSLKVESCGEYNGSYSGLGSLIAADGSEDFIVMVSNADIGLGFVLSK